MSYSELLEDIILKTGGCGIYQYMTSAIVHAGKIVPVWSYHFLTFTGQTPEITCARLRANFTDRSSGNVSKITVEDICLKNKSLWCETVSYDKHMSTIVSEWDFICDRKWIPTFIFTVLFIGTCIGAVVSGPIADKIGRKPVYCAAILLLILCNGMSALSTSWELYAVLQFLIGIVTEACLTVGISLGVEFVPKSKRAVYVLIPSWCISASFFALTAWWLHDWRKMHILSAVIEIPILASWCLFQESIRWMTTKQHTEDAERAVAVIALINRKDKPCLRKLFIASNTCTPESSNKNVLDLFREKSLRNITVGVWILWFGSYFAYYGMAFGVKSISGDLYMNMFLLNIADLPIDILSPWVVNRFGRKRTSAVAFCISGLCAVMVGLLRCTEIVVNNEVERMLALVAKLFTGLCCQIMLLYTLELYPTVVRTTALGFHMFASDVAAVIVPLVIRMDEMVRGSLYFLIGAILIMSAIIVLLCLWETKGLVLEETIRMTDSDGTSDKKYHSVE